MRVRVKYFDDDGFRVALGLHPVEADPKDFYRVYEGEVIRESENWLGDVYYYVADNEGIIHKVPIEKCTVLKRL